MMCRVCGRRFYDEELMPVYDVQPYSESGVREMTGFECPDCGASLVEDGRCRECSESVPQGELEEGLCRVCVEETRQSLEWMWGMLSARQQAWACANTDWMTPQ